ncbi:MAG: PEGA domain-containing protein, partial [Methanosarcinales archaeon]|nr:PEGA domain-containing protein [Candidatus Ethanoperedens thermophilum]
METKAVSCKWVANLSILLIIIFFCFLSVDLVNAGIGDPSLRVSTFVTPSEIERGGSGKLKVTVSEVGGVDWAMDVTVTPSISPLDGCTISPSLEHTSRIGASSYTTFYFTIYASKDATLGSRSVTTRVKYYDTGWLDEGRYGPYHSHSNTEILVKKGHGSIRISSIPSGAKVYIDGEYNGKTPVSLLNRVIEGSHTIKLEKTGYNDITKTISVSVERTSSVSE